jgi:hypothetical protein
MATKHNPGPYDHSTPIRNIQVLQVLLDDAVEINGRVLEFPVAELPAPDYSTIKEVLKMAGITDASYYVEYLAQHIERLELAKAIGQYLRRV